MKLQQSQSPSPSPHNRLWISVLTKRREVSGCFLSGGGISELEWSGRRGGAWAVRAVPHSDHRQHSAAPTPTPALPRPRSLLTTTPTPTPDHISIMEKIAVTTEDGQKRLPAFREPVSMLNTGSVAIASDAAVVHPLDGIARTAAERRFVFVLATS